MNYFSDFAFENIVTGGPITQIWSNHHQHYVSARESCKPPKYYFHLQWLVYNLQITQLG